MKNLFFNIFHNPKGGILTAIVVWLLIQVWAFWHFDMRTSVDSELYISNAIKLTQGQLPAGREVFYLTYSALIAFVHILGFEPTSVIFLHLIFAILSIVGIYRITEHLSKSNLSAFVAAMLYVLWFKFQQWNLIVYSDAIFTSLIIMITYVIVVFRGKMKPLLIVLLTLLTMFTRPTGIGLLFAIFGYLAYGFMASDQIHLRSKIIFSFTALLIVLTCLNSMLTHFVDSFIESYNHAEIIYPNISLFISKPDAFNIPDEKYPPLIRLILVIAENPIYMIKISFLKGFLFLGHIKPYYSVSHNLLIGGFLYPLYFFAFKGYRSIANSKNGIFMGSFIMFQLITICLTSENWDGRFLLPVLPLIFILASLGLSPLLSRWVRVSILQKYEHYG